MLDYNLTQITLNYTYNFYQSKKIAFFLCYTFYFSWTKLFLFIFPILRFCFRLKNYSALIMVTYAFSKVEKKILKMKFFLGI